MGPENRKRNRQLAVATVSISVLLALIGAEIAVRLIFQYNTPDTVREHSIEYIPAVYARDLLKPVDRLVDTDSAKAWGTKPRDAPSDDLIFISKNGYRGPSFDVRNKENKIRIIVLGGSSVFDQNVTDTVDDVRRT